MIKPITIGLRADRKIVKDMDQLRQYFNAQNEKEIRLNVRHDHSNSLLFLDVSMDKDYLNLMY